MHLMWRTISLSCQWHLSACFIKHSATVDHCSARPIWMLPVLVTWIVTLQYRYYEKQGPFSFPIMILLQLRFLYCNFVTTFAQKSLPLQIKPDINISFNINILKISLFSNCVVLTVPMHWTNHSSHQAQWILFFPTHSLTHSYFFIQCNINSAVVLLPFRLF